MIDALANAELDAVCPSFAQGATGSIRFWPRHQAHEAAIHRWDAESVTSSHAPFSAEMALDGIDELFEVYTARYGDQRLTQSIVLGCPDFATSWRVDPADRPGFVAITSSTRSSTAPDLTAAPEALLALWHRLPADDPLADLLPAPATATRPGRSSVGQWLPDCPSAKQVLQY